MACYRLSVRHCATIGGAESAALALLYSSSLRCSRPRLRRARQCSTAVARVYGAARSIRAVGVASRDVAAQGCC